MKKIALSLLIFLSLSTNAFAITCGCPGGDMTVEVGSNGNITMRCSSGPIECYIQLQ